jgi:3-oxoacyl-[acyl-carrier-protein] synthase II
MRRVVVTGLGIVSPLGAGVAHNWARLTAGACGIRPITHFDAAAISSRIAGCVPLEGEGALGLDAAMPPQERRKSDIFIAYALAATAEALADSGYEAATEAQGDRTGVLIGSGIGGLLTTYEASLTLEQKGPRRLSPFTVPAMLINLASGQVSIKYGFRGPNHAVVTACASGTHAIGDAARLIALGDADVMVAGGAEAAVNPLGVASFAAARALSTGYNDQPGQASRPFDAGRDGFVIAEGAGVVILEEYEAAKRRGARIYAEVAGYGLSGDAAHITAPSPDGSGAFRAMTAALARAGVEPGAVDYINAHGTSTPTGDAVECIAVNRLFAGTGVAMSSTKGAVGHLLGAAGAVEAVYTVKALETGTLPPTLNLHEACAEAAGLNLVPLEAQEKRVRVALTNSFGFGGTNASLLFRAV